MKLWLLLLAMASCSLSQSGCRFDRSALSRKTNGEGSSDAGVGDARVDANDASVLVDAAAGPRDSAAAMSMPDSMMSEEDDAGTDASMPKMTGGLSCLGTFCPFATDPVKPCCTAQEDVDKRTARAVGRCGFDMSALQSSAYGDRCWQRDQLGIVDDGCPSASIEDAGPIETGCCADDGTCGSVNSSRSLGCRHPLGSDKRMCNGKPGNGVCDPTGTFGIRVTADAAWGGRKTGLAALSDDGRGNIDVYILLNVHGVDAASKALNVSGRVCGVTFPPFYSSTLCESYQPIFPDTIWEAADVPKLTLSGRYDCDGMSCVESIDPYTYLLGIDMANREAPWPSSSDTTTLMCPSGQGAACFPDQDDDGNPGVQVDLLTSGKASATSSTCVQGYAYRGAPLSASVAAIFNGVRRTDRLLLGARMRVGSSVRLSDDCKSARGSAVVEYVDSRSTGCLVEPGTVTFPGIPAGKNQACSPSEAQFLDENLPTYELLNAGSVPDPTLRLTDKSMSTGPQTSVVRLGDATAAVSCSDVRSASY